MWNDAVMVIDKNILSYILGKKVDPVSGKIYSNVKSMLALQANIGMVY